MHTLLQFHYQTQHRHHTMKTSVVLLALATAALAAPALHEETVEDVQIPAKFLDTFTRERKSTPESADPSLEVPANQPSSHISEFGVSGRSFNLKKPIIIKKRVGSTYHVYRDSEEEKLDSPVPCRKQVRVNLCDENSLAKSADLKSSDTADFNKHDAQDDVKHTIKLAKEAVENLQKSASWKHGHSESDAELHQDIEVARQALEHIHKNLDASEESTTHDATMKQAETVEDHALPLDQTEEERLAQWKDAIADIQRKVEIVRNIEESFKSSHDGIPHPENIPSTKDIHDHGLTKDMRATEFEAKEQAHKVTTEQLQHAKLEKASEHNELKTDLADKDMMGSPSMVSNSKLQTLNQDVKARLASASQVKNDHVAKVDGALNELLDNQHIGTPHNLETLKVAEEAKDRKTESELLEKKEKSTEWEQSLLELPRDADKELHLKTTIKNIHDKENKPLIRSEAKMIKMKSAEQFTNKDSEIINSDDKIQEGHLGQLKQADASTAEEMETQAVPDLKPHESAVQKEQSLFEGKAAMTSDSLASDQHKLMDHTFQMKSAEDSKNMQHQLIDNSHMRWAQDKNFNTEMGLMKSAAETHQAMDHTKHMHSHHHVHPHAHLESHGHLRQHEHFIAHGKSADMDNPMSSSYFMNMRDMENMGQEGRFKWRPTHAHRQDTRTAYGAPVPASAPAGGAVGLFPNANVGSCGIPLLLSCNPSVVSGSLAKAHPASYSPLQGSPAYRTEEDFNFHAKRDVKKTESLVNKLNRTPTNTILKTSSI